MTLVEPQEVLLCHKTAASLRSHSYERPELQLDKDLMGLNPSLSHFRGRCSWQSRVNIKPCYDPSNHVYSGDPQAGRLDRGACGLNLRKGLRVRYRDHMREACLASACHALSIPGIVGSPRTHGSDPTLFKHHRGWPMFKKIDKKGEEDPISDIMVKVTGDHPEEGSFGVPPRKCLILVLPHPQSQWPSSLHWFHLLMPQGLHQPLFSTTASTLTLEFSVLEFLCSGHSLLWGLKIRIMGTFFLSAGQSRSTQIPCLLEAAVRLQ